MSLVDLVRSTASSVAAASSVAKCSIRAVSGGADAGHGDDKFAALSERARGRENRRGGAAPWEFYALALAMESRFRHLYSGQHEQKKQPNAVPSTTDKGSTS